MIQIRVGDFVKVPIRENGGVEKLWFEVVFTNYYNTFIGRCDNDPVMITSFKYNDFKQFNISQIIEKFDEI